MKRQLLIILAVLLTSLLMIAQRANAKEVSQLRWVEPAIEQTYCGASIADHDVNSDKDINQSQTFATLFFTINTRISEHSDHKTPNPYLIFIEARAPPRHNLF